METIEKYIDVNVPVRTVYNQWTQFEEFPHFMEAIEQVRQLDDTRLHWLANIGGKRIEWDAKISEQVPDKRIVWYSEGEAIHSGMISFSPISTSSTRVTLRIDYEPQGAMESLGDTLGLVSNRVDRDLQRFKRFIEARGVETGAWRGSI